MVLKARGFSFGRGDTDAWTPECPQVRSFAFGAKVNTSEGKVETKSPWVPEARGFSFGRGDTDAWTPECPQVRSFAFGAKVNTSEGKVETKSPWVPEARGFSFSGDDARTPDSPQASTISFTASPNSSKDIEDKMKTAPSFRFSRVAPLDKNPQGKSNDFVCWSSLSSIISPEALREAHVSIKEFRNLQDDYHFWQDHENVQEMLNKLKQELPTRYHIEFQKLMNTADDARESLNGIQSKIRSASNSKIGETTLEQRNKTREDLLEALDNLQKAVDMQKIRRLLILLKEECDLITGRYKDVLAKFKIKYRGKFNSEWECTSCCVKMEDNDEICASCHAPRPTVLSTVLTEAYELWLRSINTDSIVSETEATINEAWDMLVDLGNSHAAKPQIVSWNSTQSRAIATIEAERKMWNARVNILASFPIGLFERACKERKANCDNAIDLLQRMKHIGNHARHEIEAIKTAKARITLLDTSTFKYKPQTEAIERLKKSRRDKRDIVGLYEDARDDDPLNDAQLKSFVEAINGAKQRLQLSQRNVEEAQAELLDLVNDHYPEFIRQFKSKIPVALSRVVLLNRRKAHYIDLPWPTNSQPSKSLHEIKLYQFNNKKCILKKYFGGATDMRALIRSVEFLQNLSHPNIIQLEAIFIEGTDAYVHMPFCSGFSLDKWLPEPLKTRGDQENPKQILSFLDCHEVDTATCHVRALGQLLEGLSYVHAKGFVHGDVKLENALVEVCGSTWKVVLTDFDLSGRSDEDTGPQHMVTTRAGAGTPVYMSPEVADGIRATASSDIYSYGVCVALALAADQLTLNKLRENNGKYLRQFSFCSGSKKSEGPLFHLLAKTLGSGLRERPTSAELKQFTFFKSSDFILKAEMELKASEEKAALRSCCVCFDEDFMVNKHGIECGDNHFLCDDCLFDSVSKIEDPECNHAIAFAGNGGKLKCPACDDTYTDGAIASRSSECFELYILAKQKLAHNKLAEQLQKAHEEHLISEKKRWEEMSEVQRILERKKKHVIDSILTLACPRCGTAFLDFDGCFALTCSRADCGCHFCAYCLKDCGQDAHAHVITCPEGQGLFPPNGSKFFNEVQYNRRDRLLQQYLLDETADTCNDLIYSLQLELCDLGHQPDKYIVANTGD